MKLSAILLAAGLSRRMGCDKLLMEYQSKTLLRHAADLLCELPADDRLIVSTRERLRQLELPESVRTYVNIYPEAGQSNSLRIGVLNAKGTHFLFLAADQPGLTVEDIMPIIELSKANPDKIIYPLIDGRPSNPTIFPGTFNEHFKALKGDTGGRTIREAFPAFCIAYTPDNPERFKDLDSMDDFEKPE